ncbi:TPA: IS30-like element ISAeca1 family transposase [Vibrio cholerae]|nr:IS30-like element ISAeca1 family transposase [Vibrio cholerae]HAS8009716.1 IS30-like element ISAeca1 family transposase [Vibrio cholerae]HCJ6971309.1 IS30-like element ISAeca1 family transposase [Vibrio cholerae]HCJ6971542.1 IS30-like element ISAeca1 family transposase [Vibrio cholerae]HCJ6975245.1 IS30-like element ISAeca1 family transposase [Vibrio cholerae]
MKYQQLTEGLRYQIACLRDHGLSQARIAKQLGVHPSTISRELRRNCAGQAYQPQQAHQLATARRLTSQKRTVPSDTIDFVCMALVADWSPEQISGVGDMINCPVSHEWIYRYVARDKANGGTLYRHLRQGHKRYRKGKNSKRSVIPNPVSIDERPAIVNERSRVGDWEVYTVLGKQGSGAIVSLLERKSRLYLVQYVPSKTASAVADTIISMLKPYQAHVHTITADNGSEFVEHERVAAELEAQVYFAHPYSAWERGQNENSNGLLRQYVPKGSDLSVVTAEALSAVEKRLNFRPRKCLGFKQPQVVFDELLKAA